MKSAEDLLAGKSSDMITASPDQTVREALRLMVEKNIGAILVEEDGRIIGIWTEKDYVRNSLQAGFKPETARIGDYMGTTVHTAPHDTPIPKLQEMYLGLYIRHVLIEKDGRQIGLLSIGDVLRANLVEKDQQLKNLNALASWEYYENWRWDPQAQ